MKRILIMLLLVSLVFSQTAVFALENNTEVGDPKDHLIIDLDESMSQISKSISSLSDIDEEIIEPFSRKFASFMQYPGYVSTALGLVNGSVAFLQLIGVLEDPKMAKLINISDQIQVINDKLNEMDDKLNDITSQMSRMEANQEFHARDQKADYLLKIWKDFNLEYMEKGLDDSMVQYQGMIINGLKEWYENRTDSARLKGKIDNNQIVILYVKKGDSYQLMFDPSNTVPDDFPEDGRYIILKGDAIPKNLKWNVNTYESDLKAELATLIGNNLRQKNFSAFETKNYDFLTPEGAPKYIDQGPTLEIKKISEDAAATLIYHITSAEVNKDAKFTKTLIQRYNNYVNHLTSPDDGIDAMLKSVFLTHAFEVQVRDDINNFLDRIIIKSGVYGLFVVNVLGMSDSATDEEKTATLEQLVKSVKKATDAKENSITGRDNYSYITNTQLYCIKGSFVSNSYMHVRFGPGERRAYKDFSSDGIHFVQPHSFTEGAGVVGDINALVLTFTLNANGYKTSPETMNKFFGNTGYDYTNILTSYNTPITMPMDGSIDLNIKNVSGDYFKTGTGKNKLPDSAKSSNMVYTQKVTGSLLNTETGKLETGTVLSALGIYAESHNSWFTDETAFMAGPANWYNFSDSVEKVADGDVTKVNYSTDATYTVMYSVPLPKEEEEGALLGSSNDDEYNPLISYQNMDLTVKNDKTKDKKNNNNLILYTGIGLGILLLGALVFMFIKKKKLIDKQK